MPNWRVRRIPNWRARRSKKPRGAGPGAAQLFLEMFSNARLDFLRAQSAAGKFLDEVPSQERLQDNPLLQSSGSGRRIESEEFALFLKPGQGTDKRFAGLHSRLDSIHELLEAQVKRDRGVIKLVRLRKPVGRGFDSLGSRDNIPNAGARIPYLHGVFAAGVLDGNVPIPRFERHFDFRFDCVFALVDAEEGLAAGMPRDIDIPVGEKPMRLLGDEENRICPVALRQFAEVVQLDGFGGGGCARIGFFGLCGRSLARSRIRLSLSIPLIFSTHDRLFTPQGR